jgi:hypothetical protein
MVSKLRLDWCLCHLIDLKEIAVSKQKECLLNDYSNPPTTMICNAVAKRKV